MVNVQLNCLRNGKLIIQMPRFLHDFKLENILSISSKFYGSKDSPAERFSLAISLRER